MESGQAQSIEDKFHELEKQCIGFDNYVDNDDEHYLKTLEGLRKLVTQIQQKGLFSDNEELSEVCTEHLKLLMAPFYEADVLFRVMDNRMERVKLAHVFYLEYLRLMHHYGVLDEAQEKHWKNLMKKQQIQVTMARSDPSPDDVREVQELLQELSASRVSPADSREQKIAEFRMKKMITEQLDDLRNYRDEDMKREFYMAQIKKSVLMCFEQLRLIEMELDLLRHQAQLTPEQRAANDKRSKKPEPGSLPPLQVQNITKESLNKIPYLMRPADQTDEGQGVVAAYQDPYQRAVIHQNTADERIDIRAQFKNQVFKPGHNMPTMTLDELAESEYNDAMQRQAKDQENERLAAEEDPEDEEVMERERKRQSEMDDWKDYVPKGRGITQQI